MATTHPLLMVFTGHGKGKTTAALGLAFRALGHGLNVCVIQFIKGSWDYGEIHAARHFEGLLEFHVKGKGFTWQSDNIETDKQAALEAWAFAQAKMAGGHYHLMILDELTYLITYGILSADRVVESLATHKKNQHIVVTGRNAHPLLIDAADMVTEMTNIKHPYDQGRRAQKGIEF